MASIPIGAGRQGVSGTDLERATRNNSAALQSVMADYAYEHRLYTNRLYQTAQALELEIGEVDWMTVDVTWNANIFAPQALLAVIGSNHPAKQYFELNFHG